MQVAVQPLDKLPNGDRLCFDDGFHDQLAGGIHHRDSGRFLVNVQSNVFCTFHDGCSFLLQGQRQRHKLTSKGASFYNASYTRRMNDLRKTGFRFFRYNSCHDCVASPSPRVDRQLFSLPRGPRPRKLGSPSATARFARATVSLSIDCPAQAVLGCVENVLVCRSQSRAGFSASQSESLLLQSLFTLPVASAMVLSTLAGGQHVARTGAQSRAGVSGIAVLRWGLSADRNATARASVGDDDEPLCNARCISAACLAEPVRKPQLDRFCGVVELCARGCHVVPSVPQYDRTSRTDRRGCVRRHRCSLDRAGSSKAAS